MPSSYFCIHPYLICTFTHVFHTNKLEQIRMDCSLDPRLTPMQAQGATCSAVAILLFGTCRGCLAHSIVNCQHKTKAPTVHDEIIAPRVSCCQLHLNPIFEETFMQFTSSKGEVICLLSDELVKQERGLG